MDQNARPSSCAINIMLIIWIINNAMAECVCDLGLVDENSFITGRRVPFAREKQVYNGDCAIAVDDFTLRRVTVLIRGAGRGGAK